MRNVPRVDFWVAATHMSVGYCEHSINYLYYDVIQWCCLSIPWCLKCQMHASDHVGSKCLYASGAFQFANDHFAAKQQREFNQFLEAAYESSKDEYNAAQIFRRRKGAL